MQNKNAKNEVMSVLLVVAIILISLLTSFKSAEFIDSIMNVKDEESRPLQYDKDYRSKRDIYKWFDDRTNSTYNLFFVNNNSSNAKNDHELYKEIDKLFNRRYDDMVTFVTITDMTNNNNFYDILTIGSVEYNGIELEYNRGTNNEAIDYMYDKLNSEALLSDADIRYIIKRDNEYEIYAEHIKYGVHIDSRKITIKFENDEIKELKLEIAPSIEALKEDPEYDDIVSLLAYNNISENIKITVDMYVQEKVFEDAIENEDTTANNDEYIKEEHELIKSAMDILGNTKRKSTEDLIREYMITDANFKNDEEEIEILKDIDQILNNKISGNINVRLNNLEYEDDDSHYLEMNYDTNDMCSLGPLEYRKAGKDEYSGDLDWEIESTIKQGITDWFNVINITREDGLHTNKFEFSEDNQIYYNILSNEGTLEIILSMDGSTIQKMRISYYDRMRHDVYDNGIIKTTDKSELHIIGDMLGVKNAE